MLLNDATVTRQLLATLLGKSICYHLFILALCNFKSVSATLGIGGSADEIFSE
jgi:hypothetical protein